MTPRTPSCPDPVDRRTFLKLGAVGIGTMAGEASADPGRQVASRAVVDPPGPEPEEVVGSLVDVNVYLSRWPFRRLPCDETPGLVAKLRGAGVSQAWAGSFDALLHRDLASVNARLADECRKHGDGLLLPFGIVDPKLPDWEDDVRRCHEEHNMPGLRLHPNYHDYRLDDPDFARLLDLAVARGLVVQIALTMEDERTQHPLVRVPHVDASPLIEHVRRLPKLRLVLLNAFRSLRPDKRDALAATGNVSFDIATLENVGGIAGLIHDVPADRVLFGSYAPFFCFESAQFKLKESPIEGVQLRAISAGNAKKVLRDAPR